MKKVKYEGSRIRNFRCPESLDNRIDEYCEKTGTDATWLFRTAIEEFLAKHQPDKAEEKKNSR